MTISPPATISPPPLAPSTPTEAEFQELEEKLTQISGRPFTIGRSANIHDPATVARFEDHALYIQNQISMAKFRELHIARTPGNYWPNGP